MNLTTGNESDQIHVHISDLRAAFVGFSANEQPDNPFILISSF